MDYYNVNPGFINPKRLFNWEGTIKKVSYEMTIGKIPHYNCWFILILERAGVYHSHSFILVYKHVDLPFGE